MGRFPETYNDASSQTRSPANFLQRNSLYRAARIANVDFSVPSIILVKAGFMQITI